MDILARRQELVIAAKEHLAADMLVKGYYGRTGEGDDAFHGCSVGCLVHNVHPDWSADRVQSVSNPHKIVADHYGYPEWLALLQDAIFEGLPNGENSKWHVQLAEAVAALAADYDWQRALHRVHVGILRISCTAGSTQGAVQRVLELHERAGRGEDVSDEDWSAARSAAWSAAAWAAAWSAARSSAAWAAAWSARSAARSAAWAAAFQEIRDAVLAALAPEAA